MRLTVADALTWSRIAMVPALFACAIASRPTAFALVFLLALATDVLDGPVARAGGTASERGGQFDSTADALLYLSVPALSWYVYPEARLAIGGSLLLIAICFAIPPLAGWIRFARLPSYHTRLARAAAVALGVAFVGYVLWGWRWPIRAAAALLVLSTLEEVAITWILPQWTHPVSSVTQAWHLARTAHASDARGAAAHPLPLANVRSPFP